MKSHKKQTKNNTENLNLIFEFSEDNGEFIKRLEKVVTTHKLPNIRKNPLK